MTTRARSPVGTRKVSATANPSGTDLLYSKTNGDTDTFMVSLAPGSYQVYAWWAEYDNRRTSAPYDVQHLGGTATVSKKPATQRRPVEPAGHLELWYRATVTLRSLGGGTTCADAVKFVP
jgi:hypothetical protein